MKKGFTYYSICWAVALIVFNVISFVVPVEHTGSFWTGYALVTVMLIIQLVCSFVFFKQDTKDKQFLNVPIASISFSAVIISAIVGAVFMAVNTLPIWLAIVITAIITAVDIIAIISSKGVADHAEKFEKKVKAQTFFIKSLTVDAQALMSMAQNDEAKELTRKVYEAVRYSDPMSSEALAGAEGSITIKFKEFEEAIINDDTDLAAEISKELLTLINDRNQKCKLLK